MLPRPTQSAFSLVELSIVLVILGLLTGGILGGQSLIRAAELRSVSTEYNRYVAATQTFRDKYFALPGDMPNAATFWGLSTACSGGDANGVCNGNNNGRIDNPVGPNNAAEAWQFWTQLAKAGLVEGQFSGIAGPTEPNGYSYVKGVNTPAPKLSDAVWAPLWRDSVTVTPVSYAMNYGNHLLLARYVLNSSMGFGSLLLPEEAWNIDTKMDDGRPAQGNIIADVWDANCTAVNSGIHSNVNFDSSYNLDMREKRCGLYFRNAF